MSLAALGVSCVLGVAMSYFAFLARSSVSATCFTVIGNVCKVVTVLINVFIWDKHASPTGLAFLFGSLARTLTLALTLTLPLPLTLDLTWCRRGAHSVADGPWHAPRARGPQR